jgi:hypothetical protein
MQFYGYSIADWCAIAGLPVGIFGVGYAIRQQWRADREVLIRKNLAAESQRFLVGFNSCETNPDRKKAVEDQLERLKPSL